MKGDLKVNSGCATWADLGFSESPSEAALRIIAAFEETEREIIEIPQFLPICPQPNDINFIKAKKAKSSSGIRKENHQLTSDVKASQLTSDAKRSQLTSIGKNSTSDEKNLTSETKSLSETKLNDNSSDESSITSLPRLDRQDIEYPIQNSYTEKKEQKETNGLSLSDEEDESPNDTPPILEIEPTNAIDIQLKLQSQPFMDEETDDLWDGSGKKGESDEEVDMTEVIQISKNGNEGFEVEEMMDLDSTENPQLFDITIVKKEGESDQPCCSKNGDWNYKHINQNCVLRKGEDNEDGYLLKDTFLPFMEEEAKKGTNSHFVRTWKEYELEVLLIDISDDDEGILLPPP